MVYFNVVYFGVAVPVLPHLWQIVAYVVVGVVVFVFILTYVISTSINPVDPYSGSKGRDKMGLFDRTKHAHVIENHYCYICETQVLPKSKHCRVCNKCVGDFDHHCKWLNNCVGQKNYRSFLAVLVSGLASSIFVFFILLYIAIIYWVKPELLHPDSYDPLTTQQSLPENTTQIITLPPQINYQEGLKIFLEVPGFVFFSLIVLTILLLLITVVLMAHLLGFHLYLMCHDMSTYDYISKKREEEQNRDLDEAERKNKPKKKWWKRNKVTPMNKESESLEMEVKRELSTSLVPVKEDHVISDETCIINETEHKNESVPPVDDQKDNPEIRDANTHTPKLKPKKKKKKKRATQQRHLPPVRTLPPIYAQEDMMTLDRSFQPAGIDLSQSRSETFLEQHIVRRYSLPYPQIPALPGTEQFAIPGTVALSSSANGLSRMLPAIPVISEAPPSFADYHSSSAESLQEDPSLSASFPPGTFRRGSIPANVSFGRRHSRPIDV